MLCGSARADADYTLYRTGAAEDVDVSTRGSLYLAGGGSDVAAGMRWFLEEAGRGDIVVLRASGSDGYNDWLYETLGPVDSVETLVTHNRDAADAVEVQAILAGADGIFLAGGDQDDYFDDWEGTAIQTALQAHLDAGRPIGGTSAGLAVLGAWAYRAERSSVSSSAALANPFNRNVTLGPGLVRHPLLDGVITDSHFVARNRIGRLIAFLARLEAQEQRPVVGLGIDEGVALGIRSDGVAEVFSRGSQGKAVIVTLESKPTLLFVGQPLSIPDVRRLDLTRHSTITWQPLAVSGGLLTHYAVDAGDLIRSDWHRAWARQLGGDPDDASWWNADTDGDGFPRLVEFWYGLDPGSADAPHYQVSAGETSGTVTLRIGHRTNITWPDVRWRTSPQLELLGPTADRLLADETSPLDATHGMSSFTISETAFVRAFIALP